MRKNAASVFQAWNRGSPRHASHSIWTDGTSIFSYETCIATRYRLMNGCVVLLKNDTKYSKTTTNKQNSLDLFIDVNTSYEMISLLDIPKGATPVDLIRKVESDVYTRA